MLRKNILSRFLVQKDGVSAIEFAIIAPVFFALVIGLLEFGMYFYKNQLNTHNLGAVAQAVIAKPDDISNRDLLLQTEYINNEEENTNCAKSFLTLDAAKSGECTNGQWDTLPPANMPDDQDAYFVLIIADAYSVSMTGMFDGLIPKNKSRQVVKIFRTAVANDCNGEDLAGRVCMGGTESFNYVFLQSDSSDDGSGCDDEFSATGSSNRVNVRNLGDAECTASGWSCDHLGTSQVTTSFNGTNTPAGSLCNYTSSATKQAVVLTTESSYQNCTDSISSTSTAGLAQQATKTCYTGGNPPYAP